MPATLDSASAQPNTVITLNTFTNLRSLPRESGVAAPLCHRTPSRSRYPPRLSHREPNNAQILIRPTRTLLTFSRIVLIEPQRSVPIIHSLPPEDHSAQQKARSGQNLVSRRRRAPSDSLGDETSNSGGNLCARRRPARRGDHGRSWQGAVSAIQRLQRRSGRRSGNRATTVNGHRGPETMVC